MNILEQEAEISIRPFVKNIMVLEESGHNKLYQLPFYADGFPGILFKQAKNDAFLLPKRKRLTDFFLHGQTIQPIEIAIEGPFKLVIFQLSPFASKILFGVDPKELNDELSQ